MRWRMGRQSQNIEDQRGSGGGFGGGMGGGMPRMPMGGRRAGGIGGLGLIVIVVLALLFGFDPSQLLQGNLGAPTYQPGDESAIQSGSEDELKQFSATVLASTEDVWSGIFQQSGKDYHEPTLVLFSGGVQSACGFAQAAVGPFYCPGDQKVYLDLDFFYELEKNYGAPGDFAQAYVITHEIGHHVQTLLGTTQYVNTRSRQVSEAEANKLSVALELQADCYSGVWANRAQYQDLVLEKGDLEEALSAANAIGDDTLQKQAQGYVVPDSFTHGTSTERVQWFRKGMDSGQVSACASPLLPAVA
jgi:predicted metalloprotease